MIAALLGLTIWAARRSAQQPRELGMTFVVIMISVVAVVAVEPYLPTLNISGF
jgi:hypothetical protein